MPPPPNTTAATAIDLGPRPVHLTVDVTGLTTPRALWYRLTAVAGEFQVGLSAVAAPSGAFVMLSVFTDAGDTYYLGLGDDTRIQMPVAVGLHYWLGIETIPVGSTTVAVTVEVAPNLATPVGSLAINDESEGFPLVVLSAADGTPQQFRSPFVAGETAVALPSGPSLWSDHFAARHTFVLYDATLIRRATIAWPTTSATTPTNPPITSNRRDRFYVGDATVGAAPARITTITAVGAMGATVWTLPASGLTGLAVSPDETIAYIAGNSSDATHLLRWDLLNDVAQTPLAAVPAGYAVIAQSLTGLADGTILVGYYRGAPIDNRVQRYAADGTALATYPIATGGGFLNRVVAALDDPASFWVWSYPGDTTTTGGMSRFQRIRVSDGVVLTSFEVPQYAQGLYRPTDIQPPAQPYGHSNSCPMVVLPFALPAVGSDGTPGDGDGDGDGTDTGPSGGWGTFPPIPPGRIRRVRRAPHLSAEQVEQFFSRFQLDLEAGVGNAVDPGADPQVYLRWSDDGGHTWRAPLAVSAGTVGAFRRRAIWRRLGSSRDRVFEVSMSDPVKWALLAASLLAAQGTS